MNVDIETLAIRLPMVIILGILLFDLVLLLTNNRMTISRAVWRQSIANPWYAVIAAGLVCLLLLHLFTTLFF